jgi:VanZ family protein
MVFYAAGFAWFDPRRGAGQCALAFIVAVTASVAAVAMEVAQVRLPGRFFDPTDIAWSMAGALAGAFVAWLGGLFLPRRS